MNCYIHEQKEAIGACVYCGKFICEECRTEIKSKNYCKKCVNEVFEETNKKLEDKASDLSNRKIIAALFAILLGSIGIHKFYLGKIGLGILYVLFCWTGIPTIIGIIEGIIYLCTSDEEFNLKYGRKID